MFSHDERWYPRITIGLTDYFDVGWYIHLMQEQMGQSHKYNARITEIKGEDIYFNNGKVLWILYFQGLSLR